MIGFLARLFSRSEPVLSEATQRDTAAIARLHAASFNRGWSEDEIDRLLLERNVMTHRAVANGRLVGFIMSRVAAGEAEILSVAVVSSYRGKGLARRMLNLHMGRLSGVGTRVLFLEVDEGNAAARALYRRAGFAEAGRREGYYTAADGKRATALVLRRDLA
jgi:[ribosomal protein S18]-alanine N-acetyltransferase